MQRVNAGPNDAGKQHQNHGLLGQLAASQKLGRSILACRKQPDQQQQGSHHAQSLKLPRGRWARALRHDCTAGNDKQIHHYPHQCYGKEISAADKKLCAGNCIK